MRAFMARIFLAVASSGTHPASALRHTSRPARLTSAGPLPGATFTMAAMHGHPGDRLGKCHEFVRQRRPRREHAGTLGQNFTGCARKDDDLLGAGNACVFRYC